MDDNYRDRMFIGPPPSDIKNPIGRWWCPSCDAMATECTAARGHHSWVIKWMENKANG